MYDALRECTAVGVCVDGLALGVKMYVDGSWCTNVRILVYRCTACCIWNFIANRWIGSSSLLGTSILAQYSHTTANVRILVYRCTACCIWNVISRIDGLVLRHYSVLPLLHSSRIQSQLYKSLVYKYTACCIWSVISRIDRLSSSSLLGTSIVAQ